MTDRFSMTVVKNPDRDNLPKQRSFLPAVRYISKTAVHIHSDTDDRTRKILSDAVSELDNSEKISARHIY